MRTVTVTFSVLPGVGVGVVVEVVVVVVAAAEPLVDGVAAVEVAVAVVEMDDGGLT